MLQIRNMRTKSFLYLIVICITWFGCKPETTPNPSASSKSISSFVFKAADNPSLNGDISGTINNDSVKVSFPESIDLSNLVPTVIHDGVSINPPNRTARDFSSPVTYTVTAQNGSTKDFTVSARNVTLTDTINLAFGKWRVIKDSVSVINYYRTCGGTTYYPVPGVWVGAPGDYWDFKAGNIVELKYSTNILSGGYQFIPGYLKTWDQCYTQYARILELNETTATFYYTATSPNGGHWGRMVWLKR